MKRITSSVAVLTICLLPFAAQAQNTDTSGSSAGSDSYSRSGNSGATLNYTSTSTDNAQYDNRPGAYAPDVGTVTGNACALGNGGSAGGGGWFALSIVLNKESDRCGNETDAAIWGKMGNMTMASAMMCRSPQDAAAYLATYGTPCPGQPGYKPATQVAAVVPAVPRAAAIQPQVDTTTALNDASLAAARN